MDWVEAICGPEDTPKELWPIARAEFIVRDMLANWDDYAALPSWCEDEDACMEAVNELDQMLVNLRAALQKVLRDLTGEPTRWISPEDQIANVRRELEALRYSRRFCGRADAIRATEAQLADLEARHERGELEALADDGVPF